MVENESVGNHSAIGWAESTNGSKNLAIAHGRVRNDVEKKMWMKKINKWRSTSQKPPDVVPSKRIFGYFMVINDY